MRHEIDVEHHKFAALSPTHMNSDAGWQTDGLTFGQLRQWTHGGCCCCRCGRLVSHRIQIERRHGRQIVGYYRRWLAVRICRYRMRRRRCRRRRRRAAGVAGCCGGARVVVVR